LTFISHAFNCFIGSLKSSKMRSNMFFIYPLTKLLEIRWTKQHGSFFSCCHDGVCIILEEVMRIVRGFCPPKEVYGKRLIFFSRRVFSCFTCSPFPWLIGWFINHLSNFG
jgi:hypothetical protein